jgi:hypothetical protein
LKNNESEGENLLLKLIPPLVCLDVQKVNGSFFEAVAKICEFPKVLKTGFLNGLRLIRFQEKSLHIFN